MSETDKLIARIRALAERTERSTATISTHLFGNGIRFGEIERGGSLSLRVFERAKERLAELEKAA